MPAESVHALRVHERGGPEPLRYEEAPMPFVGLGDALVRVHAASFTPTELAWPETWIDRAGRARLPVIPAHEASGEVVALGTGTSGASVGDEVYAITDWYRDGTAHRVRRGRARGPRRRRRPRRPGRLLRRRTRRARCGWAPRRRVREDGAGRRRVTALRH